MCARGSWSHCPHDVTALEEKNWLERAKEQSRSRMRVVPQKTTSCLAVPRAALWELFYLERKEDRQA